MRTFPTSRREDYNYPPHLNVLHYNVDDIENASARAAVRALAAARVKYSNRLHGKRHAPPRAPSPPLRFGRRLGRLGGLLPEPVLHV